MERLNSLYDESDGGVASAVSLVATASVSHTPVGGPLDAQDDSGSITYYTSHPAEIVFSSTDGGSVAAGTSGSAGGDESSEQVIERYEDSLSGVSQGATAIADEGFHFVWWMDGDTGDVLSTSTFFAPERPESGWPEAWRIVAVFERNVYHIVLNPNGGTSGGGTTDSVTLVAEPGKGFVLPINGTDIEFAKRGSAFSGWNAVADPSGADAFSSYSLADGQTIEASDESMLELLGHLSFVWSGDKIPTLTLYAQWVKGQVTITYKAGEGGDIEAPASASVKGDGIAKETIDSSTGTHAQDASFVGPQGSVAHSNARYHFDRWNVSGSSASLADSEASSPTLSAGTVTRASYYADATGLPSEYHPVTFVASFAPNSYIVTYASNGGSGSIADTNVTYGSSSSLASSGFERAGYKLSGWNLAAAGTGASYALGAAFDSAVIDELISSGSLADADGASLTLYAQWEKEPSGDGGEGSGTGGSGSGKTDPGTGGSGSGSGAVDPGTGGSGSGSSDSGSKTDDPGTGGSGSGSSGSGSETDDPGTGGSSSGSGSGGNASGDAGTASGGGSDEPSGPSAPVTPSTPAASSQASESSVTSPSSQGVPSWTSPSDDDPAPTLRRGFVSSSSPAASANAEGAAGSADPAAAQGDPAGSLAAAERKLGEMVPVAIGGGAQRESGEDGSSGGFFGDMTPAEAAGTAVAAVAAVGAIAGLVGLGASIAGATAAGAAAIGTATTIGLSSAADMAADLAAESASKAASGGQGLAGAGRGKKDDDDDKQEG
ncbi:MAG: InlB B-repeat-containing protein [Olsenella sp.]|nr:InlB B-repeat-containing protein [Olsenella sp.]